MTKLLQIYFLSSLILGFNCAWFDNAIFYQVYPQSFKEGQSDNQTGHGNLKGIIEKLDYFVELKVDGIWLNPIYKAETHGYDITDFNSIDPKYGTKDDFETLTKEAGKRNIKIIMDFVPNHVSDKHDWFKKSIKKEGNFSEYFVWHPGKTDPNNAAKKIPPNNWLRIGAQNGESAWEWNDERKEFFFFQFGPNMPDLNLRNEKVKDELKSVLKFWLDLGIGGFRIDAISHGYEVSNLTDEPLKQGGKVGVWDDLNHIYTVDQPEAFQIVYDWRKLVDDYQKEKGGDERLIMTESYTDMTRFQEDPKNSSIKGAHLPFYFNAIFDINKEKSKAQDFKAIFDKSPKSTAWVIGNHDQSRTSDRVGKERIDLMNAFLLTIGRATVTYYGEEIGMHNVCNKFDESTSRYKLCEANDDKNWKDNHSRTPFQWDDSKNAGFSSADSTLFPVATDFKENNLKSQKSNSSSHFNIYKKFAELKKHDKFQTEKITVTAVSETLLMAIRQHEHANFTMLFNLNDTIEQSFKVEASHSPHSVHLSSSSNSKYELKHHFSQEELDKITVQPLEVLVLYSKAIQLQCGILSGLLAILLLFTRLL